MTVNAYMILWYWDLRVIYGINCYFNGEDDGNHPQVSMNLIGEYDGVNLLELQMCPIFRPDLADLKKSKNHQAARWFPIGIPQ